MYELKGLREIRRRRFMTQVELAQAAGLTEVTIVRLEHGQRARMSTVRRLAEALQVAPEELLREPEQGQQEAA